MLTDRDDMIQAIRDESGCIPAYAEMIADRLIRDGWCKGSSVAKRIVKDVADFVADNEIPIFNSKATVWAVNSDNLTDLIVDLRKKYMEDTE